MSMLPSMQCFSPTETAGRGIDIDTRAGNACCSIGVPIRNRVGPVDARDTHDNTVPSGATHRTRCGRKGGHEGE